MSIKRIVASSLGVAMTLALVAGPATARNVVVTDTVATPPGAPDNVFVLPCADLLTDSIRRIFTDGSVSEVFGGENQLF